MELYAYDALLTTNGRAPQPGAVVQFYAESDTSYSTPLEVFAMDGRPIGTAPKADAYGYINNAGGFKLPAQSAVAKSGLLPAIPIFTVRSIIAASDAAYAAAVEVKAKADAGEFQGKPGPAGPNTVPTKEALAAYASESRLVSVDENFKLPSAVLDALGASFASQLTVTPATPTSAINAWLAQPSALGVKRLLGSAVITAPLVAHSNTHLDATGTTIKHGGTVGMNMIQNAAVTATGTRDKNITVVGGDWDRGTFGGSGPNLHSSRYRRVDGLRITGQTWKTAAGKYCVNVGDVTDFEIDHLNFLDTNSDGVHIQGPASGGRVHHIRGITHDDAVAITGNDYAAYNDVYGDVTDVRIWDINARSGGANLVKVLAGKDCRVDDITVENIRGRHSQNAVWLGDDNGEANTDNGTHGILNVSDVDTVGDQASSCQVFGNLAKGAKEVNLSDITLRGGVGQRAVNIGMDATGTLDLLRVHRVKIDGLATRRAVSLRTIAGATVKRLEITSPTLQAVGGNCILLEAPSVTLGTVTLSDLNLTTDDTANSNWIDIGDLSPVGSLTVNGGRVQGGRCLVSARTAATITLTGGLRLINLYKATFTITVGEVAVSNVTNKLDWCSPTRA
ncbi:hypothetical protein [Arthrobacter sp. zg-Y769]|uniref:hypothetical protein n=1 Tax=Arthrobacter sp. zg-Y769 TaxID=2894191 RepID=UPI001E345513|nr:hypothetical protein [Arthrobacter sp. zg-Y769]MCC9205344.1 hypothetical protein [Arthrobacter sp. zg-Y769]